MKNAKCKNQNKKMYIGGKARKWKGEKINLKFAIYNLKFTISRSDRKEGTCNLQGL